MAEQKYTLGMLVKDYGGSIGHIKSVGEHPHGHTPTLFRYDNCALSVRDVSEANAARLVSCWNACLGISNPEVIPELVKEVAEFMDAMECITPGQWPESRRKINSILSQLKGG